MTPHVHLRIVVATLALHGAALGCGDDGVVDDASTSGGGGTASAGTSGSTTTTSGDVGGGDGDGGTGAGGAGGADEGGGGSGAAGGEGGGGACEPGASRSCYRGPAGTLGVGACAPGIETCVPDGSGWGPCEGETLPVVETCLSPEDDDCDGEANEEGDGCVCSPGAAVECYEGPAGTAGVGACRAGFEMCNELGTAFGACIGANGPGVDACDTPADEDCDGDAEPCSEAGPWARRLGGTGLDAGEAIATDADGNVFVAGSFSGTLDLGGGPLALGGDQDLFVIKLDPTGNHVWSRSFGGVGLDAPTGLATDAAGDVIVTGFFEGSVDFGGGAQASAGDVDVFVLKLDRDGDHVWSRRLGGVGIDRATGAATDPAGRVIVTGEHFGTGDFGGAPLTSAGGADVFVVVLDAAGEHVWSRGYGGAAFDVGHGVAADPAGAILLTGHFGSDTIDFGGPALSNAGGADAFIVKLDASGGHLWSQRLGGTSVDVGEDIATDAEGNVAVTGTFLGTTATPGGPLVSAGELDGWITKLDPLGGHLWTHRVGGRGHDEPAAVAFGAGGEVVVAGWFEGETELVGGTHTSAGSYDPFVVQLAPTGEHVWSGRFGGSFGDVLHDVATDADGHAFVTGYFGGTAELGGTPMTAAELDAFLVQLEL